MTEDEDVAAAVKAAFRESGIVVVESFRNIESFEKTPTGVRMNYSKDGSQYSVEAALGYIFYPDRKSYTGEGRRRANENTSEPTDCGFICFSGFGGHLPRNAGSNIRWNQNPAWLRPPD